MASTQVRVTETTSDFTYARLWTGAAYTDLDDEAVDYDATSGTALWQANNNVLYIGDTTKFNGIGFRSHTAPGGTPVFTFEYSTAGDTWTAFDGNNPFYDSTSDFSQDGFIAWQTDPAAGAWTQHDSGEAADDLPADAYWIRIKLTGGYGAPSAQMYHLLRLVTFNPPIKLRAGLPVGVGFDINKDTQIMDIAKSTPEKLELECVMKTMINMPNVHLVNTWLRNHKLLYVEDLAQTAVPDLTADSPYIDYTARLVGGFPGVISPNKMKPQKYSLVFMVHDATAVAI
jgi:hypothetical protein